MLYGELGRICPLSREANETYSEAKRQFNDRNRDVLMNVRTFIRTSLSPHKWWSTQKVYGVRLELVIAAACQ